MNTIDPPRRPGAPTDGIAAPLAACQEDEEQLSEPAPVVVFADVVVPGKALVVSSDGSFSGRVVRDRERGSGYLVEDEWGDVVGRARTYRHGAARLAAHHGRRVARVEMDFETADQALAGWSNQ